MKKEERLHRLMGDVDDDLVAEAAHHPIPLWVWLPRVTAAVAAVALTVGVVLAKPWASEKPPVSGTSDTTDAANDGNSTTTTSQNGVSGNVPVEGGATLEHPPTLKDPDNVAPPISGGTPTTSAEWTPDIWYEQKWEEKPMWMKFPEFDRAIPAGYDGKMHYVVREFSVLHAIVEEYLEDVNLHGYDNDTETPYDIVGKIYRIRGLNPACAVVLQYPGDDLFHPAVNVSYVPKTLGQLMDDLSLWDHLRVGTVYHSYRDENGRIHDEQYAGLTKGKVWELLLSDPTLPNAADQSIEWKQKLSVRIDMPLLGYNNISISLSEDGYLRTNLLDSEKIFHIGRDKVDAFMDYVEENCRLEEELIPLPGDTTSDNDTTMTSPAQPPLKTGTTHN